MDHDDVLEAIELAAVEPGGLDRLVAGDTPTAAAIVAHLAGCEACAEEFRRLSRATPLLRDVVRTTPPEDLRERTLAFVREHGRARGDAAIDGPSVPTVLPPEGGMPARPMTTSATRRVLPWVATIAAVIALVVSAAGFFSSRDLAGRVATQATAVSALERVERATLELSGDASARRVELVSTGSDDATGTLLFSPSTSQLVVVAYDLERPGSDVEYRCWVAVDGQRRSIGRMFFADELAFWVGKTEGLVDLPAGTAFGVSPAPVGSTSLEADPVIRGEL